MAKYLDPKVDLVFKRIFGEHPALLKSLLNALLPLPDDALIVDLEYLSPEQIPDLPPLGRRSIVDVKCRDVLGRTFIVEMQMLWNDSFKKRIVFGASRAFSQQLQIGQHYRDLKEVYALALINTKFDDSPQYYHRYQIARTNSHNDRPSDNPDFIEGLEFVIVELPKFRAEGYLPDWNNQDRRQLLKLWLRFLREINENCQLTPDDALFTIPEISQALNISEIAAMTQQELAMYDSNLDAIRVESAFFSDAREDGEKRGVLKGIEIGEERGRADGMQQGIAQGQQTTALAIARQLLAMGMSVEQVAQSTELSWQVVKDLTTST